MFTGDGFSLNLGFRNFVMFTGDGFSLISDFMTILCTPSITTKIEADLRAQTNDLYELALLRN